MAGRISTIRDVAALAGVAISTVSAALNGDGRVAPATRERVMDAARRLRYQPNRAAAVLASKERGKPGGFTLAYLTAVQPSAISSASEMRTLHGARQRAPQLGYRLEHVNLDGSRAHAAVSRSLYMRGVAGIIIGRMWPTMPQHLDFEWENFSVVYCGRDHADEVRPFGVEHDIFESTLRLFREVRSRGYRRIGVCVRAHNPRLLDDFSRLGAVLAAQAEVPRASDRIPPYMGDITGEAGADAGKVHEWVRRHRPDAVIGFNAGDYWILRSGGWRIPKDLGYADMHVSPAVEDLQLCGIVQDQAGIGAAAVDLLDQQIRYRRRGLSDAPMAMLTYSRFCEGATLPGIAEPREVAANQRMSTRRR